MENNPLHKASTLKNLYLYLVCFISLIMVIIPTADLLNLVLKKTVFTEAKNYYGNDMGYQAAEVQRSLARDISYMLVGGIVFIFHWRQARKKEQV